MLKIQPQLELAEQWVERTFTGETVLTTLAEETDTTTAHQAAAVIIVSEALVKAIPQLDLVLTPNGFGIVSNSNIAPASKERVERLISTLVETRDAAIAQLLLALQTLTADQSADATGTSVKAVWAATEQSKFFRATLFPTLAVCDALGIHENCWANYLALRPRLQSIENNIAREFLSPELLAALRLGQFPALAAALRPLVLSKAAQHQKGVCDPPPKFGEDAAIVQLIRATPDIYAIWSATEIGERWERPTVFENNKERKGYWF